MAQAKIIKIPNGDAFIEIGHDYVRIGTGDGSFFLLDKHSINAGADSFNYQLSPEKVTYHGFLNNISPIAGLSPVSPKYSFSTEPINALVNVLINSASIASAVGIGI